VSHPLDHHLLARLTPTYRREAPSCFVLEDDIAIMNDMLQQLGIDIFANPDFDTWVLFALRARVDNNCWSNPIHTCISPLFSLFNHSCEPNARWATQADGTTLIVTVEQDVSQGEQLFLIYDQFARDDSLAKRRGRFRQWLDDDCQCSRCVREASESAEGAYSAGETGVASWDTAEKPVLPEDLLLKKKH